MFITQKVGNLLYYSLNEKHPLFKELKSIVSKTLGIEGGLRKAPLSIEGIKIAFINGSFASKCEKATSDIDIMIIGIPNTFVLNEKVAELERKLKREINISMYSREEYEHKKLLKSGFTIDVINNPKIMLIGKEIDL
ncbi:MAG: nucleotidyltransferase domain-containing protein [Candidatus Sifarchaeia archaeon]